MAINYTQTDTVSDFDGYEVCAGAYGGGASNSRQASDGGSAGSTPVADTTLSSGTARHDLVEIHPDAGTTGSSGTWTVRLNVTTGNMNLSITAVHICRVNSSGVSQETIGSATGLSISLSSTGVKSQDVTGSAVTLAAGDLVTIVFTVVNGAMSNQSFFWTPNQNIDSPFTAAAVEKTPWTPWRQLAPIMAQ